METKDSPRIDKNKPEASCLKQKTTYNVALGGRTIKTASEPFEKPIGQEAGTIAVGAALARKLGLPRAATLNFKKRDGVFHLGPLVGIMTARSKSGSLFGEQQGYFQNLLKSLGSLKAFGYIFLWSDINWEKQIITGYCRVRNNSWQKGRFPLPDVVYNRCLAGSGKSTAALTRLAALNVRCFNTTLGSKWHVYQQLTQKSAINCLPETLLMDSSETLKHMLESHQDVYIKSLDGHLGKGIYRICKAEGGYRVQRTGEARGVYVKSLKTLTRMYGLDKRYGRLIVQKSIKPGRSGSHFDIRVLVQKDGQGCWQLTGMAVRIGLAGQITTNLHTGGRAESLEKALRLKGYNAARTSVVRQVLGRTALQIAKALEYTTENLGELGLDFVLDAEGRPWFLEANPRAGRRSFAHLGLRIRRLAVQRPMEYACYLAGFKIPSDAPGSAGLLRTQ